VKHFRGGEAWLNRGRHRFFEVIILQWLQFDVSLCKARRIISIFEPIAEKIREPFVDRRSLYYLRSVACFFFDHDSGSGKPAQNIDLKLIEGTTFPCLSHFFFL